MFNLDYENRRERGWISIEEVETEADDVDADILCLRAYESVTNKRVGKIDKAIEQLVTKLELKSYASQLKAVEYYREKNEQTERLCHYVTLRFKTRINQTSIMSLAAIIRKSLIYKSVN